MKILVIGATGNVGSRVVEESLARGHSVTAVSRQPATQTDTARLHTVVADASDREALSHAGRGHDAAVAALSPWSAGGNDAFLAAIGAILAAVKQEDIPYVLFTGGASSLEIKPGRRVIDEQKEQMPTEALGPALAVYDAYKLIRASDVNWTFLSPAGHFEPGARTGQFRLGGEQPVTGASMQGTISPEDFAVAVLDELERPLHRCQQFNIAY